ncbi:MAG TPA: hypothetical protein VJP39_06905, partial [Gaiellaceae bacterium]|nr:hypothetical protein [Gaiellaceae bacterium]
MKKRRARKPRAAHLRPELIGLALGGLGVFLAAVLWFGLSGGPVAHGVHWLVGAAAYLTPLVLVPLGVLMVARSELVDVGPFRLGLPVTVVGLLMALGRSHGGQAGRGLEALVSMGLGSTGSALLGVVLTIAGVLLLTGASLGAWMRRGGQAVRVVHERVRDTAVTFSTPSPNQRTKTVTVDPPVDVAVDYPDVVTATSSVSVQPPVLYDAASIENPYEQRDDIPTQESLFDA